MAAPFTPRPGQPDDPDQPADLPGPPPPTISIRPDMSLKWVATTVEGALSLGLPEPDGCAFSFDPVTRAPEVVLRFNGHHPHAWDDLNDWAAHHGAEVIAAPAAEMPGHWYASTIFTRNYMLWTCAAYIPATSPGPHCATA
jgi:hypothetical protein